MQLLLHLLDTCDTCLIIYMYMFVHVPTLLVALGRHCFLHHLSAGGAGCGRGSTDTGRGRGQGHRRRLDSHRERRYFIQLAARVQVRRRAVVGDVSVNVC